MSNSVKAILVILLLAVVSVSSCVAYTWPHWWLRVGKADIFPSGPQSTVTVYRSSEGNLLFGVQEDSLLNLYIYYPTDNKMGIPNFDQFYFLPGLIYAKDVPVPVVYTDNRVKVETDFHIIVENETLQFTPDGRRRIVADLKSY